MSEQKTRSYWLIVALIIAIAAIPAMVSADVYINPPAIINAPGTYVINSDYTGPGPAIWVDWFPPTDDVVIDGNNHILTGTGPGSGPGIYVSPGCDRVHVKDVIVDNYDYGIYYQGVNGGLIENCDVLNNELVGIVLFGSNNIDVRNNRVRFNNGVWNSVGIYSLNCFNNEISDNDVFQNPVGIVSFATAFETITENRVDLNIDGIWHFGTDAVIDTNEVTRNGDGGVVAVWSDDASISHNTVTSNGGLGFFDSGIFVFGSPPLLGDTTGLIIDNNTVDTNVNGVRLFGGIFTGSHHNLVNQNRIRSNTNNGIELFGFFTRFNTIDENTILYNGVGGLPGTGNGVLLRGSRSNTITDNYLEGNDGGIYLTYSGTINSDTNVILNNTVWHNDPFGIELEGILAPGSPITGVTVDANLLKDNLDGIYLFRAWNNLIVNNVIIENAKEGMWLSRSTLNTIYNNCFNNTVNVAFDPLFILSNNWNTLIAPGPNIVGGKYFGGNYWANPSGTGHSQVTPPNDDEFSNAALFIATGNTDNFPLWNPLVASFDTDPSPPDGEVPFTVDFTDTSLGNPTCWFWDFGDGSTSDLQNPSHTYTTDGTYDVTFTASRCPVAECAGTSIATAAVHVGPQADFTAHPKVGPAPLTVTFTDTSTVTGTSYSWDFGDSGTSTLQNPVHKYMNPGKYTVSLTITGTFGTDTETKVDYIDVRTPLGPVADFTASPQSGTVPLTVNFIDMSSGDCTGWAWDFDNDAITDSTDRNPTHTYTIAGDYTVKLTVTNTGGSDSKTMVIHAMVPEPVADFIATPRSGYNPLEVTFIDRSYGTTPDTEYDWDFGDGATSTERDPVHVYTSEGSYNVYLKVTNPAPFGFEKSDDIQKDDYIVVSSEPIPVASILPHDWWLLMGDMPFTVDFIGVSTYSPTTWLWTFGDGTSANQQDVSHTFTEPGIYDVTLRVFDEQGRGTQDTISVVVRPVAGFTAEPDSGDAPLTVQFTDTSTGNPDYFEWSFTGITTDSYQKNPTYTFIEPGTYYVWHRVRANGVFSNWYVSPIVIGSTPAIIADPTVGHVPLTVEFEGIAGGFPNGWWWEFGDDFYANTQTASHTYTDTGIYTVKLWVYYPYRDEVSTTATIIVLPKADFISTPSSGNAPLTIEFTDTSLGSITDYYWTASDGWISTEQNPSHTFTQSGMYYVWLTVETAEGLTDTTTQIVWVYPTADFTWYPSQGEEPLTVQFVDTSLGGGFMSTWNFGDGTTATFWDSPGRSAPVHVYEELGSYTVSLTRMGYDYLPDTETKVVNLRERPPVADFTGSPRAGSAPLTVDFTDLSSAASPLTYYWEFGDGVTSTVRNPSHKYTANGDYRVNLTVTNAGGSDKESKTAYIRVSDVPLPVADFTASPRDGLEDLSVQFKDASINAPTSWHWQFGDGTTSNLQSPIHVYTTPGWYNVILTVSNAQGQNALIKSSYIYVRNTPPVAAFTATPRGGDAPLSVKFTDQSTGLAITSWKWDFGDGGTSTTQSPLYVYNNGGNFTVNLTVANDGGSDSEVKTSYITVNPAPPIPPANVIQLYPGWNLVSVPKKLQSGHETAIAVFGGVNLSGHAVLTWDAGTGVWKQVTAGTVLKPLDGIWIYSVTRMDVNLTFDTGPTSPVSKQLYAGWNSIGYAGTSPMSARDFLTLMGGLNGNWNALQGYLNGATPDNPIIRDSVNPLYSDNRPMYPTRGYWIAMEADDVLQVVV